MEGLKKDENPVLKFVLVGESGVGKSSLLLRFVDDVFSASFIATIGIDFKIKTVTLKTQAGVEKQVKIQVWDTAGQERFRTITSAFYNGAEAIIIVYDVTDKQSFNRLEHWMEEIDKRVRLDPVRIVVGNKCDRAQERKVGEMEGKEYAHKRGYEFWETSSLTGKNVHELFMRAAQKVFEQKSGEIPQVLKLEETKGGEEQEVVKKKDCC